jgi:DNA-binding PadR family transcriptional regulator
MHEKTSHIKINALPQLSHLQFAVLEVLGTEVGSGKDLRKRLSERGIKKSGPSFYQMMARLEEAKFVEGSYKQEIIEGQIIKERQYRILADGIRALQRTKQYYTSGLKTFDMQPAFA